MVCMSLLCAAFFWVVFVFQTAERKKPLPPEIVVQEIVRAEFALVISVLGAAEYIYGHSATRIVTANILIQGYFIVNLWCDRKQWDFQLHHILSLVVLFSTNLLQNDHRFTTFCGELYLLEVSTIFLSLKVIYKHRAIVWAFYATFFVFRVCFMLPLLTWRTYQYYYGTPTFHLFYHVALPVVTSAFLLLHINWIYRALVRVPKIKAE